MGPRVQRRDTAQLQRSLLEDGWWDRLDQEVRQQTRRSSRGPLEALDLDRPTGGGGHAGGSRIIAVVGGDGVGKSKLCAALLALAEPTSEGAPRPLDKEELLAEAPAERRRNFSCYNHVYSQRLDGPGEEYAPRLHLIDTPGHVDRLPLVERALRVAQGAVVVCSAQRGIDAACGRMFSAVERLEKPAAIFLNGVDEVEEPERFDEALNVLEQRLGVQPVVLFAPARAGDGGARGSVLLNVLKSTLCSASEASLADGAGRKVGPDLAGWAAKLRLNAIRSLAKVDEEMSEALAEFDGEVPGIQIEAALQRAVAAGRVMPLISGSAKTLLGIGALQEIMRALVPAGDGKRLVERLGIYPQGPVSFAPEAPFLGLVCAEQRGADGARLLQVRVLDGTLRPGQRLQARSAAGEGEAFAPERVLAHGLRGELDAVQAAGPGDLALVPAPASVGPVHASGPLVLSAEGRRFASGDGLSVGSVEDWKSTGRGHCTFEIQLGDWGAEERERLFCALSVILCDEDGLLLETDEQTGQRLLYTMGTFHLKLLRERLAEEFGVTRLSLGPPRVCYRATLQEPSAVRDLPQAPGLEVEVLPSRPGTGVSVEVSRPGSQDAAAGLERGARSGLQSAGPFGTPITDVRVCLVGTVEGREEDAAAAASAAVRRAVREMGGLGRIAILEPVVQLEVDVPADAVEAVVRDLQERRGLVWGARPSEGQALLVEADVPLREVLDYGAVLESLTGGGGFFVHRLRGYRKTPEDLGRRILEGELSTWGTE